MHNRDFAQMTVGKKVFYYIQGEVNYNNFFKEKNEFRFKDFASAQLVGRKFEIFAVNPMFERYLISNLGRFWHIKENKFVESFVKSDNEDIALITLKHNKEENGTRTIRKIEAVYEAFFGKAGSEIKYTGDENEEKLSFAKFQLIPFPDVKEDTVNTSMKEKLAERRSLQKEKKLNTANLPVTNDKVKNVTNNPPKQTREKHREYLFKLDPDSARILDSIKKKYKTTSDANAIKAVLKLYSEANA